MAEEQPESKTKRRIVKNPETFRERAVKAAEQEGKPSRKRKIATMPFRLIGRLFKLIAKPFIWSGKLVASTKVGRILGKPLKIVGRILVPRYVRNSWKELRGVTWPNWTQSRRLTSAVLIFALIFGVIIAVVDYGLDKLFKELLLK